MKSEATSSIRLPPALVSKLATFRRALIGRRALESLAWCVLGSLAAFWLLFLFDRMLPTPVAVRALLALGCIGVSVGALYRLTTTLVGSRGDLRLARIIRRRDPRFGDNLVGALELAESRGEQARSRELCEAALGQVADQCASRDLSRALPPTQTRLVAQLAFGFFVPVVACCFLIPAGMSATFWRLVQPTSEFERYTFARIAELPNELVVPHDESRRFQIALHPSSRWTPAEAKVSLAGQSFLAQAEGESYSFELPPLIEATDANLRLGDAVGQLRLVPKLRPQWTRVEAVVDLPDYLDAHAERPAVTFDMRSGSLEVVDGSRVTINATASNELAFVSVNGRPASIDGNEMTSDFGDRSGNMVLNWVDVDGLGGKKPLRLEVANRPDRSPSLIVESGGVPPNVLLDQQLSFQLLAEDDFGIAKLGMEWILGDNRSFGERILGGGGEATMQLDAFFQASSFNVSPGELSLRFWAIDELPGREKVYTDPIRINLVSRSEHAVWISEEFDRWRQAAMDVRDRELGLYERNRELAAIKKSQRDRAWREQLAEQARAEAQNGKLLEQLTRRGEDLLRQAARNADVDSGYVETLAATIQSLQELSRERMPRVAELLEKASDEESKFEELADAESTQADVAAMAKEGSSSNEASDSSDSRERVGLAGTTIVDSSERTSEKGTEELDETDQLLDAIEDQEKLVAAFDAIADEMQQLLGRMEGSTLVKRLKAISRMQDRIAGELARGLEETFGRSAEENTEAMAPVSRLMAEASDKARTAVDDLEAFFKRREIEHYGAVLKEIQQDELLNRLTAMRAGAAERPGAAISEAEFWADNLDRWADDLVHPGKKQPEEGSKNKNTKSLPPAVVLEVLRVLESEVNLREQTRMAERGREAMSRQQYMSEAIRLSESQDLIRDRLDQVVGTIQSAPGAALHFAAEMEILSLASSAMVDATKTLVSPETGPDAIAAQTEAIELLLRSKKVDPEGGESSSGGQAGGSAGGDTNEAAAALLGKSLDALAVERQSETKFAVGRNRNEVPEQWSEGVQQYQLRLEQRRAKEEQP